jgi:hypothetical protein
MHAKAPATPGTHGGKNNCGIQAQTPKLGKHPSHENTRKGRSQDVELLGKKERVVETMEM